MRKVLIAAATVAALARLSQAASAADVITNMTSDRLAVILTAMTGKKAVITKPESGVEVVTITDNGDIDFIMTDCAAKGCASMQPTMFFNKDEHFNLTVVNSYNTKELSAQAFLTADNRVFLVRLYVFDGGVTEENLKTNIGIYLKAPGIFAEHALGSQTTASAGGSGSVPVAAPSMPATSAGVGAQAGAPPKLPLIERVTAGHKGHALR